MVNLDVGGLELPTWASTELLNTRTNFECRLLLVVLLLHPENLKQKFILHVIIITRSTQVPAISITNLITKLGNLTSL